MPAGLEVTVPVPAPSVATERDRPVSITPTRSPEYSVNHMLPSGPAAIDPGAAPAGTALQAAPNTNGGNYKKSSVNIFNHESSLPLKVSSKNF